MRRALSKLRRRRLWLAVLCAAIAGYVWLSLWPPRWVLSVASALNPDVLFYVESAEKRLALTIDDGPHPEVTPPLLDVLRRHGVRATFFLLGENARRYPELVERIREEGHELGNHLMRDRPSILLRGGSFVSELEEAEGILELDEDPRWFRPGSGWFTPWMLRNLDSRGYRCVLGSLYPHDTKLRWVPGIQWLLRRRAFPGAIIVLHDGERDRTRTFQVLEGLLPEWAEQGWKVGTLTELVESTAERD